MLLEVDACDRRAALRARLAEPVVDDVDDRVSLALLTKLERAGQVVVHRRGEPFDLLGGELRRRLERREACAQQDLVRVRSPDPGERTLVAEEGVELSALASEDLREPGRVEVERVRPEVAEIFVELRGRHEPDARPFLLPGLGQHELAAVREPRPEHRRLRPLRAGREVAQPAGAHEVDAQDEVVALEREEEVLAAPARALETPPVDRRKRRGERLERGDVRRPGLLDRRARHERVELPDPGLDLG